MAKIRPVRAREFNEYILWRNIPAMMRGIPPEEIKKKFGLEDEIILDLCQYTNQKEFTKRYKPPLSQDTLTDWNKIIDEERLDKGAQTKLLGKLTSNVKLALYGTAMKYGKAPEVGLFLELAGDYVPKSEVINPTGEREDETLDEIEDTIKTKQAKAEEIRKRIAAISGRAGTHRARTKGTSPKAKGNRTKATDSDPAEADL